MLLLFIYMCVCVCVCVYVCIYIYIYIYSLFAEILMYCSMFFQALSLQNSRKGEKH